MQVVVVVGITGAGKSSTANTLAGRTHKPFALSNSVASVTRAAAFRDYSFMDVLWRVVDTPGLFDTNRSDDETRRELANLRAMSPHGVTAFVFVVPRGRFTSEQERAIRELTRLFGPEALRHAVVAVTSATDPGDAQLLTRDALLEEINALPTDHYFRQARHRGHRGGGRRGGRCVRAAGCSWVAAVACACACLRAWVLPHACACASACVPAAASVMLCACAAACLHACVRVPA
jgi:hypothetical protein